MTRIGVLHKYNIKFIYFDIPGSSFSIKKQKLINLIFETLFRIHIALGCKINQHYQD